MIADQVRPQEGKLFAVYRDHYAEKEGGIFVPEKHRHAGYTATIVAESRDAVLMAFGIQERQLGRLSDEAKETLIEEFGSLVGKRVILNEYQGETFRFDGQDVYICPGSAVRAVLGDDVEAAKVSQPGTMKRCRFCGPAKREVGKGSMFVGPSSDPKKIGVRECPICHREQ